MNFGPSKIPVKIYPMVEEDGQDHVVWYGFVCGTPEFTVEEGKRYLIESEEQLPASDPRVATTGVDEIRVFHIDGQVPISMVRQALHSNRQRRGDKKRPGFVLPRQVDHKIFLGVARILARGQSPESADVQLAGIGPQLERAVGVDRAIVSVDLFQCVNPSDKSTVMLWRFGVEPNT